MIPEWKRASQRANQLLSRGLHRSCAALILVVLLLDSVSVFAANVRVTTWNLGVVSERLA